MPVERPLGDVHEKVAALDSEVQAIKGDISELKRSVSEGFSEMRRAFSASSKKDYGVWIAAAALIVAIIGGLWASAISPIENDLIRQTKTAETLAAAVLAQDAKIGTLETHAATSLDDRRHISEELASIRANGSPITDKRLTTIEYRLDHPYGDFGLKPAGEWPAADGRGKP